MRMSESLVVGGWWATLSLIFLSLQGEEIAPPVSHEAR
jgi:hypothetical protein